MAITAIASMYLLGNLGVEGGKNYIVDIVGGTGVFSLLVAALINMTMLVRIRNEHQRNSTSTELPPTQRSARGFSASDVEENALALALV